jgi:hypothetical protein
MYMCIYIYVTTLDALRERLSNGDIYIYIYGYIFV